MHAAVLHQKNSEGGWKGDGLWAERAGDASTIGRRDLPLEPGKCACARERGLIEEPGPAEKVRIEPAHAQSTSAANPEAIDQAKVAELEELQEGLFQRLAALFLQELPSDLARLRGALGAGDASEVKETAHKIKGSAAAVGAVNVSGAAAQLEQLGREGDLTSGGPARVRLEESLAELAGALGPGGSRS
jgi:HPt (histidine-containing phosphotransfer) domain-containing protein